MIKLLDQKTIDKIAAGEVIERPSSVVKELLENSIDAKSTAITVEIKEGGISYIRVTDNGCGIPKEQVKTAYLRHATSKIESIEDLDTIMSLGFRGEALSTIAAVAQVEMVTKTADSLTGVKYTINGGEELEYKEVGVPDGTTIIVRNLFYNTPARKKFLKTAMTEASYIADLVLRIALSHPDISLKLMVNGQTKLSTSGNGKVKDTIYELFGRDITNNLLPISYEDSEIKISGFIGKPFIARGNRGLETYFINKRFIRSNIVNRAIEEGYKTFVMQHKFPFTVLYIDLPTDKCDVNVHPTKMEFKYDNEKRLFEVINRTVLDCLTGREIIPKAEQQTSIKNNSSIANINTNPNKGNYAPKPDFRASKYSPSYNMLDALKKNNDILLGEDSGKVEVNISSEGAKIASNEVNLPKTVNVEKNEQKQVISSDVAVNDSPAEAGKPKIISTSSTTYNQSGNIVRNINEDEPSKETDNFAEAILNSTLKEEQNTYKPSNGENQQMKLFEEDDFLSEKARKEHRVIGQVFGTYWLIEYDNNLYIMDQHAAHEKVKYEELLATLNNKQIFSQQLMPPMVITVSYAEREAILEYYDMLMNIGYEIEEFGGNEFKINAVPSNLFGIHGREMFMDFVGSLINNSGYVSNDIFVRKLSTMACKAAIKGNMRITAAEADALIDKLLTLDNPYTCPHGRPTIISMSEQELEKKFKRIV